MSRWVLIGAGIGGAAVTAYGVAWIVAWAIYGGSEKWWAQYSMR